jgi:hypothetical protein
VDVRYWLVAAYKLFLVRNFKTFIFCLLSLQSFRFYVESLIGIRMFPKILKRAVQDRVGTSKVIQAFKDTYDYVISEFLLAVTFLLLIFVVCT